MVYLILLYGALIFVEKNQKNMYDLYWIAKEVFYCVDHILVEKKERMYGKDIKKSSKEEKIY